MEENVLILCVLCKRPIDNCCKSQLWENDAYKICKACADSSCGISYNEGVILIEKAFQNFTQKSIEEVISSSLLMSISSGQLYSYRHNIYKASGKAKRNLKDEDLMYLLPEDKKNYFFCALSKSFNNHTSNDYTFKVLLPEAILYLFAKVQRISRIKAEVLLSSYSLQRNNELLNKISDEDNDFILETNITLEKEKVSNDLVESSLNSVNVETESITNQPAIGIDKGTVIDTTKTCSSVVPLFKKVVKSRNKVKCPVCGKFIFHLKRHLITKHKWDEVKAKSARLNFGLNAKRKVLTTTKKKAKSKIYKRKICPMLHCTKELLRLGNHLRQFHKLVNFNLTKNVSVLENFESESDEKSNSSSDFSDNPSLECHFDKEIFVQGENFLEVNSSSDEDWLASEYVQSRFLKKDGSENSSFSKSHSLSEFSDNEDEDDTFYMTSSIEDSLMQNFVEWLVISSGGRKPKRSAVKHKGIIMGIVRHKDNKDINYVNLSKESFLNSWMTELDKKGKKPGTIKTYLGSIKHFLDFCLTTDRTDIIGHKEHSKIVTLILQWGKSLQKSIKENQYDKDIIDFNNFPTAEEIVILDNSDIVKDATNVLKSSNTSFFKVNKTSFCLVRDYLITCIVFDNASRPGAICNMTLNEFSVAFENTDGFVVSVKKHKTSYKGPAHIALSKTLYLHVQKYITFLRNTLDGVSTSQDSYVFVSWHGGAISSSMLTTQFSNFWKKATGKITKMTPTIVRKFITTTVHENHSELKQNTANLLCHSLKTAEQAYALFDNRKKAGETSKKLHDVQRMLKQESSFNSMFMYEISRGNITLEDVKVKFKEHPTLGDASCSKSIKKVLDSVRYIKKKNKLYDNDKEYNVNDESDENPSDLSLNSSAINKLREHKEFSPTDLNLVFLHLAKFIKSNEPLIKKEILHYLQTVPECKVLLEKFGVSSLIVKIRTERKKVIAGSQ
nr:uncharacterized protein LOC124812189 [Hydra vulgaris]